MIPLARRYRLLSEAGRGGMGTVWRAHDELLDRDVAVKEVRLPERLTTGERRLACRRMVEEARATAALRHPGVVQIFDIVMEDGRPWIIMEFIRARSLHQVLAQDGPLPAARAAEVGLALLSVLRAAHAEGILHRDVKPSNVLLCEDGRVLLSDFGLAVHTDDGVRGGRGDDTLVSGIEGSPAYLSPERVRGLPSVVASDLWALGATLYAAVEGRSPFLRSHALASMVAVLLGEYEPPRLACALSPIVAGLLREDPAERLSAEAVEALLRDALRTLSAVPGTLSAPEAPDEEETPDTPDTPDAVAEPDEEDEPPGEKEPEAGYVLYDLGGTSLVAGGTGRGAHRRTTVRTPASRRPRFGALLGLSAALAGVAALGAWSARWTSVSKSASSVVQPFPGVSDQTTVYHADGAFSVEVPADWSTRRISGGVAWTGPVDGEGMTIVRAPGDALTGLHAAERRAADDGAYPGYHRLRIESAPDLAPGAAEWEFTWDRDGGSHALRSRVAGYEFFFYTHASRWTPGARLYDRILRSFDPEPSTGE
ncbi:serine/threonine-protein kinase [Actinomadura harenae]|uniref:serine/threonine-protein kinase n=1 Tax=Actinomadura harenae TaxID=2483351 RepID=UPI0013159BAB|nr:serine/threonine-protein kinase [Actinomadura harenae]